MRRTRSSEAPDGYTREMFEKGAGFIGKRGLEAFQQRLEEIGRRDEAPLPEEATPSGQGRA